MRNRPRLAMAALLLTACAQQPPGAVTPTMVEPATGNARALLVSSSPADGSTVTGPVSEVQLHFSRPVRLIELALTAPDGSVMPTMINSAGEQQHYRIPVSVDQPGRHRVDWRVSVSDGAVSGSFAFTNR